MEKWAYANHLNTFGQRHTGLHDPIYFRVIFLKYNRWAGALKILMTRTVTFLGYSEKVHQMKRLF